MVRTAYSGGGRGECLPDLVSVSTYRRSGPMWLLNNGFLTDLSTGYPQSVIANFKVIHRLSTATRVIHSLYTELSTGYPQSYTQPRADRGYPVDIILHRQAAVPVVTGGLYRLSWRS